MTLIQIRIRWNLAATTFFSNWISYTVYQKHLTAWKNWKRYFILWLPIKGNWWHIHKHLSMATWFFQVPYLSLSWIVWSSRWFLLGFGSFFLQNTTGQEALTPNQIADHLGKRWQRSIRIMSNLTTKGLLQYRTIELNCGLKRSLMRPGPWSAWMRFLESQYKGRGTERAR